MEQTGAPLEAGSIDVERFALETLSESWQSFKTDALLYIVVSLIAVGVGIVTIGVLAGPLTVGAIRAVQRRRRGVNVEWSDVWSGMSEFGSAFVAFFIVAIASGIGLLLAVVPGLFVLTATCFAFHEITYRRVSAVVAIQNSFQIAKRNVLHVLLLMVAMSALNSLGGALAGFGCLISVPFSLVLITIAYEKLTGQTPAPASPVVHG